MSEENDKTLIGWTRNISAKEVRRWVQEQISDNARYDVHLAQHPEKPQYTITMYWVKGGE